MTGMVAHTTANASAYRAGRPEPMHSVSGYIASAKNSNVVVL